MNARTTGGAQTEADPDTNAADDADSAIVVFRGPVTDEALSFLRPVASQC